MRTSINTRLIGSLGVILLLMAIVGGFAIFNLGRVSDLTSDIYNKEFVGMQTVEQIRQTAVRYRLATTQVVNARTPADRDTATAERSAQARNFDQQITALKSL